MAEPEPPVKPFCDNYPIDPNFPIVCDVDYTKAYCCIPPPNDGFVVCDPSIDLCLAGTLGPDSHYMTFPILNDEDQPMLKTALNGTTMSTWVKLAFQEYCDIFEDPIKTATTIITMGNMSQPCNPEQCQAIIKAFQYGWGSVDKGNRCRITIMDQQGSSFSQWAERMGINPEGDSTPVQGKYRMKVQWGWYVTGGAPEDICGQPPQPLGNPDCGSNTDLTPNGHLINVPPEPGFNSAFIICSPVCYFITDWINVHWENGKFIYELEGVDLLVRGQENIIQQFAAAGGEDGDQMYFTKACEILGRISFPPFRVEFKALDSNNDVVDMEFVPPDGVAGVGCREFIDDQFVDCLGWGPLNVYVPNTKPPLNVIQDWLVHYNVNARDLTNKKTSDKSRTGITMNYDPTYKFIPNGQPGGTSDPCEECTSSLPQYGRLLLWADGIPNCQGNFNDEEIGERMKAVYVVNGGNCSPVLQFAPSFRWHSMAAMRGGGGSTPVDGDQVGQKEGFVKTNCPIASGPGPTRQAVPTPTRMTMKSPNPSIGTQETTFHFVMANLAIGAIEAELRVQGDPSSWLCSPIDGYGRCVGIVFINPFFLEDIPDSIVKGCPQWLAGDPTDPAVLLKSNINELLTNKGWFIMGVDHQIKDGQYITTLRLKLVAPGAELNEAGSIVNLGGWENSSGSSRRSLPYGGLFGCLERTLVGNAGTAWGKQDPLKCPVNWVGGGTACAANYFSVPPPDLPPD
jgi:hypothetical protein